MEIERKFLVSHIPFDLSSYPVLDICQGFIRKRRYLIPLDHGLTAELDVFLEDLSPLRLVEVEFETGEEAVSFVPPQWFGTDVTWNPRYKNSVLCHSRNSL